MNLPTGINYTVEEQDEAGFVATYTGETGTICLAPSTASITNTKDEGGLIVSKSVVSDVDADKDIAFTFTVKLKEEAGTAINGTYGDMNFENGVATFTLKDSETASATGLPGGIKYEVTEEANNLFETTSENEEGVTAENASAAAFRNTRKTGTIELSKAVVSDIQAEETAAYSFKIVLKNGGQNLNGVYGGITFNDGNATVTVLLDDSVDDKKDAVLDVMGSALLKLKEFEETVPQILVEIRKKRQEMEDSITIV